MYSDNKKFLTFGGICAVFGAILSFIAFQKYYLNQGSVVASTIERCDAACAFNYGPSIIYANGTCVCSNQITYNPKEVEILFDQGLNHGKENISN